MNDPNQTPREPAGGAGIYDVDPPQHDVHQETTPVVGDVEALPEDLEL
jgi:hypothetical protein